MSLRRGGGTEDNRDQCSSPQTKWTIKASKVVEKMGEGWDYATCGATESQAKGMRGGHIRKRVNNTGRKVVKEIKTTNDVDGGKKRLASFLLKLCTRREEVVPKKDNVKF